MLRLKPENRICCWRLAAGVQQFSPFDSIYFSAHSTDRALAKPQYWKHIDLKPFEHVPDSDKYISKGQLSRCTRGGRGELIGRSCGSKGGDRMREGGEGG